jgi:hypothetical protein
MVVRRMSFDEAVGLLVENADHIAKQVLRLYRQGRNIGYIAKILDIPEDTAKEALLYAQELEAAQRNPHLVRNNMRVH